MKKTAFLFSGQGAQYPGMMKDICEQYSESSRVFQIADVVLEREISGLAFAGTEEELNLTHNTQPCVLAADLAAYKALISHGIMPDVAAGFSLGEYAALAAVDCLSLEAAFSVIQKRADYMQEAVPVGRGAMAAIGGLLVEEVQTLCDKASGYVIPANLNCPGQIVVSGEKEAVNEVVVLARTQRKKAMVLPVSAPFHCEMLKSAADRLVSALSKVSFNPPGVPVYMNVDGKPERDSAKIAEKLILQAKSPVHWEETLRNMYRDGVRVFMEIGPGKTLSGFVKKTFKDCEDVISLRVSDIGTLNRVLEIFKENS